VSTSSTREDSPQRRRERLQRLVEARKKSFLGRVLLRFQEIDGATLGGLLSIEFFTTIIPIIILGFSYFSGFSENASPGTVFIRELGVEGAMSDQVRATFGTSSGEHSAWTIIGVGSFLIWGIPMAISIAGMYAKAWRREQFGWGQRLLRGTGWFALYLMMLGSREAIHLISDSSWGITALLFTAGLIPTWVFWSLAPIILVRDGGRGAIFLALAGLAGVAIDGVIIPIAGHFVFPLLLSGWTGFGPIGVAMALMTWCGVAAFGWVLTACIGAVVWERTAPPDTVIDSQTTPKEPGVVSL
jgi:uncharacterized BrkB/YihY/UPF0761 family membrane protein